MKDSLLVTSTLTPSGVPRNGLICVRPAASSRSTSSLLPCSLLRHIAAASSTSTGMSSFEVPMPRSSRPAIS
ncbi:hypothetical protein [Nonomuraea sp. WAC 01424]|uniref:hypothetical protein n=1 Tax=Nonomuraea sp. WAC 01424 TaxID=2203200 RepID=UPI0021AD825E|nr:hypothetical protein [Nonomuraea sp. WAC 01424]